MGYTGISQDRVGALSVIKASYSKLLFLHHSHVVRISLNLPSTHSRLFSAAASILIHTTHYEEISPTTLAGRADSATVVASEWVWTP